MKKQSQLKRTIDSLPDGALRDYLIDYYRHRVSILPLNKEETKKE